MAWENLPSTSTPLNATNLLDNVYPVGSIYMSVNSTNPSTLFGGTWVAWGAGRVPVGIDTNDTSFNTVEKTGGEKTHTLTSNEMPEHSHSVTDMPSNDTGTAWAGASGTSTVRSSRTTTTGGGQPHNILQPYIVCYMWKRTA